MCLVCVLWLCMSFFVLLGMRLACGLYSVCAEMKPTSTRVYLTHISPPSLPAGLDSVMGELICLLLHDLAKCNPKRIVLVAVHSPSSRLFTLFTHLTILTSNGELAYFGKRKRILPFLEGLGYACPPRFNPADFILELASTKIIQNHINSPVGANEPLAMLTGEGLPELSSARATPSPPLPLPEDFDLGEGRVWVGGKGGGAGVDSSSNCNNYKNNVPFIEAGRLSRNISSASGASGVSGVSAASAASTMSSASIVRPGSDVHIYLQISNSSPRLVAATKAAVVEEMQARLGEDQRHQRVHGVKGAQSSQWVLFKMNLWRAWIQESREKIGLTVRAAMNVTLGLLFGLLYLDQIPKDNGRNTAGFLFSLLVTMLIASSVNVCLYFPFDFAILMREYYSGTSFLPSSLPRTHYFPYFLPPSFNMFLPPSLLSSLRRTHIPHSRPPSIPPSLPQEPTAQPPTSLVAPSPPSPNPCSSCSWASSPTTWLASLPPARPSATSCLSFSCPISPRNR